MQDPWDNDAGHDEAYEDAGEAEQAGPALNPPQADAVAHVAGPLLVFAGAGSGKTRVITYRVANLVAHARVAPYRILAVTFTNKAAGEMRERLGGILGPELTRDLWVGTFHATCAKLLRLYPEAAGLTRSFVIYDSADQRAVVTRVLKEMDLDERRYAPRAVLGRILKEKQEGRGPDEMDADGFGDDVVRKVFERYEARLRDANAVDFEDIILKVVRILEAPRSAPEEVQRAQEAMLRKYDYLLVDEFQDTNLVQYRLVRRLAERTRNLCVVGDDDQSIYKWRGADIRNIRGFRTDYPDAKVVKLEQNYRSTSRIVASALGVIAPSRDREPKELWTANGDGEPLRVVGCADERDEAAVVVKLVEEARASDVSPSQIAVFYRVHAQSRVLEEALRSVNQPYQIVGGAKFYDRAEVKDALAYLRLLSNPRSDVDFLRIVNVPARGIGPGTVDKLQDVAAKGRLPLRAALDAALADPQVLPTAAKKRVGALATTLRALETDAERLGPAELLAAILVKTGYKAALQAEDTSESDARLENLGELEGSMLDFEVEARARGEEPTLDGFLERVTLQSDQDGIAGERVTLMTVHAAKGLEFQNVILTGMEEDMFPYRSPGDMNPAELDEERRLAYVAITRARERLVMTHVARRLVFGQTRMGVPSRFLANLPPGSYESLETPRAREQRSSGGYATRGYGSGGASYGGGRPGYGSGGGRPGYGSGGAPGFGVRHGALGGARASEASAPRTAGERYVERDEVDDYASPFDDEPDAGASAAPDLGSAPDVGGGGELRRGSAVRHPKFGRGEVRKVLALGEPAVVAFFPGWGEVKVLARFLSPG